MMDEAFVEFLENRAGVVGEVAFDVVGVEAGGGAGVLRGGGGFAEFATAFPVFERVAGPAGEEPLAEALELAQEAARRKVRLAAQGLVRVREGAGRPRIRGAHL